jgi:hypothetical protein
MAFALALAPGASLWAGQRGTLRETHDEFFIISSVNLPKHQLVLKLPTEVTLQMTVTGASTIVGEHGQPVKLEQLRSGDTAYISYARSAEGAKAIKIRLGPMTVQELHKRYLNSYAVPIPPPPPVKAIPHQRPAKVDRSRMNSSR